ncbi:hypothetical protein ACFY4I_13670 [Streptomyces scabiei]|uniref:hypothetical protein n=1 Tax=Streptomyces scabiei TaxID=1930 RepID=UPI0036CBE9E1
MEGTASAALMFSWTIHGRRPSSVVNLGSPLVPEGGGVHLNAYADQQSTLAATAPAPTVTP